MDKTDQIKLTLLVTLEDELDTDSEQMEDIIGCVTTGIPNENIHSVEVVEWKPENTPMKTVFTVFKTTCSTDWKTNPHHSLHIIGTAPTIEEAHKLANDDIVEWQKEDIAIDAENAAETGWEQTDWPSTSRRWEMFVEHRVPTETQTFNAYRVFAQKNIEDGGTWSATYHITVSNV